MFRTQFNEDTFVKSVEKIADALEKLSSGNSTVVERVKTFDDVKRLLRDGYKIDAIKLFRTLTGAGLKDAKDVVDQIKLDGF